MIFNFDDYMQSDNIVDMAYNYYEKKDYAAAITFLSSTFDACSAEHKSKLLVMVGNIYMKWLVFDKAIGAYKLAMKYSQNNSLAWLYIAKAYRITGCDDEFQNALNKYLKFEDAKISEDLIRHNLELARRQENGGFQVLPDNAGGLKEIIDQASDFFGVRTYNDAVEFLEELLQNHPESRETAYVLTETYRESGDVENMVRLCWRRYHDDPSDVDAIATILEHHAYVDVDEKQLVKILTTAKVDNIAMLAVVLHALDSAGYVEQCLEVLQRYAKLSDSEYNHEFMLMQFIAYLKNDNIDAANKVLAQLQTLYGMLGDGNIFKHYNDEIKNSFEFSLINPYGDLYKTAENMLQDLCDEQDKSVVSDQKLWDAFELAAVTLDGEDIVHFMQTYEREFTTANFDKILAFTQTKMLPITIKTEIIAQLVASGMREFDLYTDGTYNREVFHYLSEIEDYPECYKNAYHYAFAYTSVMPEVNAVSVCDATIDLLAAMKKSKRVFSSEIHLAAAILCNAFLVEDEGAVDIVAERMRCSEQKIMNYLKIIEAGGNLEEDDNVYDELKNSQLEFWQLVRKCGSEFTDK